jgi:hypothetical protein
MSASPENIARLVRALASAIPTVTSREIEGAGRAAPFDATASFVQVVADSIPTRRFSRVR